MNVYGLIGYPLGHSFSKQYFTRKFERMGLADCRFELFPLEKISELPALVAATNGLKGLAVTIPHKSSVIPFLDHIENEAKEIGSVNCIILKSGRLHGYNTDVAGFERTLVPLLCPQHTRALILGSGGSSRAVQYVLNKLNITYLVVSRNAHGLNGMIAYDAINEKTLDQYKLIINCTPVGMYPDIETRPNLPYHLLSDKHLLYDLVYNPPVTGFLSAGAAYGAQVMNGQKMLEIQAEENWRIWNS